MTSYRLQDNPRIHAIGICERKNCGARFYRTEDIRQKYCSKSCAKAAQRHRRDARVAQTEGRSDKSFVIRPSGFPIPLVQKAGAGRLNRFDYRDVLQYAEFDLANTKQLQDVVRIPQDGPKFVVDTKAEADVVVDRVFDILNQFGWVTKSDLNALMGLPSTAYENNVGWTSLNNQDVTVRQVNNGWAITFPRFHWINAISHKEYASLTKPLCAHIDFEVTDGDRYFINRIFAPNVEFLEDDFGPYVKEMDSRQPEELLIEAWVWQKELEKIMLEAPSILKEIENTIRTLRARVAEKHDIRFSQIDEFMSQYEANKASG